jgi:polyhydroxyalkanoate synthesis regulator phasin
MSIFRASPSDFDRFPEAASIAANTSNFLVNNLANTGKAIGQALAIDAARAQAAEILPQLNESYLAGMEQINNGNIGVGLGMIFDTASYAQTNPLLSRIARDAQISASQVAQAKLETILTENMRLNLMRQGADIEVETDRRKLQNQQDFKGDEPQKPSVIDLYRQLKGGQPIQGASGASTGGQPQGFSDLGWETVPGIRQNDSTDNFWAENDDIPPNDYAGPLPTNSGPPDSIGNDRQIIFTDIVESSRSKEEAKKIIQDNVNLGFLTPEEGQAFSDQLENLAQGDSDFEELRQQAIQAASENTVAWGEQAVKDQSQQIDRSIQQNPDARLAVQQAIASGNLIQMKIAPDLQAFLPFEEILVPAERGSLEFTLTLQGNDGSLQIKDKPNEGGMDITGMANEVIGAASRLNSIAGLSDFARRVGGNIYYRETPGGSDSRVLTVYGRDSKTGEAIVFSDTTVQGKKSLATPVQLPPEVRKDIDTINGFKALIQTQSTGIAAEPAEIPYPEQTSSGEERTEGTMRQRLMQQVTADIPNAPKEFQDYVVEVGVKKGAEAASMLVTQFETNPKGTLLEFAKTIREQARFAFPFLELPERPKTVEEPPFPTFTPKQQSIQDQALDVIKSWMKRNLTPQGRYDAAIERAEKIEKLAESM